MNTYSRCGLGCDRCQPLGPTLRYSNNLFGTMNCKTLHLILKNYHLQFVPSLDGVQKLKQNCWANENHQLNQERHDDDEQWTIDFGKTLKMEKQQCFRAFGIVHPREFCTKQVWYAYAETSFFHIVLCVEQHANMSVTAYDLQANKNYHSTVDQRVIYIILQQLEQLRL